MNWILYIYIFIECEGVNSVFIWHGIRTREHGIRTRPIGRLCEYRNKTPSSEALGQLSGS